MAINGPLPASDNNRVERPAAVPRDGAHGRPVPYLHRVLEVPATADQLRKLYVDEGRTVKELAVMLGVSRRRVAEELDAAGIPLRTGSMSLPMSRSMLASIYQQHHGSIWKVARHCGVSPSKARAWLIEAEVIEPVATVDLDQLRDLYVDQRLGLKETARRLQVHPEAVRESLQAADVPIRHRRHRQLTAAQAGVTEEALRELYVEGRLSIAQVASKLGASAWYVRKRIAETGLNKRPGTHTPRTRYDRDFLIGRAAALYQQGLSMHQVAADLGVSTSTIAHSLHEAGAAIRPAGFPNLTEGIPPRHLIADLYADPEILAVLRRHNVLIPPQDQWRKTSPHEIRAPLPLPAELLRELYEDVGLPTYHIALLCGVGVGSVKSHLARYAVHIRPDRQPSPWVARNYSPPGAGKVSGTTPAAPVLRAA